MIYMHILTSGCIIAKFLNIFIGNAIPLSLLIQYVILHHTLLCRSIWYMSIQLKI